MEDRRAFIAAGAMLLTWNNQLVSVLSVCGHTENKGIYKEAQAWVKTKQQLN